MPYFCAGPDQFKTWGRGPFTARSASDNDPEWPAWMVMNAQGVNCLNGPGGAVLTDRETAEIVAARENGKRSA